MDVADLTVLVIESERISREGHTGQVRKNGDQYITHPERVANKFREPIRKAAAWLHDVFEDTSIKPADVIARLTDVGVEQSIIAVVVDAVDHLTRRHGVRGGGGEDESYHDFIERVMENEIATDVKLADIEDNLRDLKPGSLRDKYELAQNMLRRRKTDAQLTECIIERCVDEIFQLCGVQLGKGFITIETWDRCGRKVATALSDFCLLLAEATESQRLYLRNVRLDASNEHKFLTSVAKWVKFAYD